MGLEDVVAQNKGSTMPLVRMKAAPVKTDGERFGNEFMNGAFFSAHLRCVFSAHHIAQSPGSCPVFGSV